MPAGDTLQVETSTAKRLGHVEAKLARRVLKFIEGGNEYTAAVAASDTKGFQIIIRETKQAPQFAGVPSFPVRKGQEFRAHARDSLLRDADVAGGGEEVEDGDAVDADEDLEGMHAVEPGEEDAADLADDDSRADDSY